MLREAYLIAAHNCHLQQQQTSYLLLRRNYLSHICCSASSYIWGLFITSVKAHTNEQQAQLVKRYVKTDLCV